MESVLMATSRRTTDDSLPSIDHELYSAYENSSPCSDHSGSSSRSVGKAQPSVSTLESSSSSYNNSSISKLSTDPSRQKEPCVKVPYPVLSDHRDPSSVLILLQKETQTTSKKIIDVGRQIEACEQRLLSNRLSEREKKTLKNERVKLKQQLDALKKHERRVSLQIDFITTKTEIKGLEEEQKQNASVADADQNEQIKILLGKLKQKLDKMKIYMRTRNEQMKKLSHGKAKSNASSNDLRKASSSSASSQKPIRSNSISSNKEMVALDSCLNS